MSKIVDIINTALRRTACYRGSDPRLKIRRISTGILGLDIALSGGLCRGRYTQIWGGESAGKSSMVTRLSVELQQADSKAEIVYVDVEGTFDPVWAAHFGLDTSRFAVVVPANGEEVCDIVAEVVRNNNVDLVVVDSVGAMAAKAEYEKTMDGESPGAMARLMSRFFRVTTAAMQGHSEQARTAVLLLNQKREKLMTFGDPEMYPGGNALKHFNSVSIRLRRGEEIRGEAHICADIQNESGDARGKKSRESDMPVVAYVIQMRTDKNKTGYKAPVMRTSLGLISTPDLQAGAFDHTRDVLRLGHAMGVVRKDGGFYSWDGSPGKFHGMAKAREWLSSHVEEYYRLYVAVLKEAIGEAKFGEIKTSCFGKALQSTGKGDGQPGWGKKKAGKWQPMALEE